MTQDQLESIQAEYYSWKNLSNRQEFIFEKLFQELRKYVNGTDDTTPKRHSDRREI